MLWRECGGPSWKSTRSGKGVDRAHEYLRGPGSHGEISRTVGVGFFRDKDSITCGILIPVDEEKEASFAGLVSL